VAFKRQNMAVSTVWRHLWCYF